MTIEVAGEYYKGGTNGITISLNEDSDGLPGNAVHTWNLTNLPLLGTCCKLDIMKDTKGLKVKRGVQYWVVGSTDASTRRTIDCWDFTWNDASGAHAYNQGAGWKHSRPGSYAMAFGVFGEKAK